MITPQEYFNLIKAFLEEEGNPEYAEKQMKYMRYHFEYYGLKAGQWSNFSKEIFKKQGIYKEEDLKEFVRLCMEDDHREFHYIGIQMMGKSLKYQSADFIHFVEEMLLANSWWDSVDWLNNFVGILFKKYPELKIPITEKWMASGNIWLQRVCIIFQLKYKNEVDTELLFKYILELKHSNEFFIQKASGWALRQYSKFNPDVVVEFIRENQDLSNLTKREGLKYLKKNGIF